MDLNEEINQLKAICNIIKQNLIYGIYLIVNSFRPYFRALMDFKLI